MNSQPIQSGSRAGWWRLPHLEIILTLSAWVLSVVFTLVGLTILGPDLLPSLAVLLIATFLFNFLLIWLDRRGMPNWLSWGARLGNLAFLTVGIYFTGGFESPFFIAYTIYIVIAGLRHGWRGTFLGFLLCFLSWVILGILMPPGDLHDWAWAAVLVGAFLMISFVVGILSERQVNFWQEAQQRNREIEFLREAGQSLGASLDPQDVLAGTLSRVNNLLDVEAASLALVDPETGRITLELAIGGGNEAVQGLRLEPGEGIVGQVIQEGKSIFVPDVSVDPHWYSGVDQVSGYQTRSILCVPLRTKGQVIGAMEVLNKRDGPFTEEDRRILSSLADLAAQHLENARLHDQIRQHAARLQTAYDEVHKLDELKSGFIRNVSHELRTPLALMEGYLELLLDGQLGALRAEQRQALSLMADRSAALSRMVNDIISLQTIGAMGFDLEILSLAELVQVVVDAVRPKAEKASICLELDLVCPEELLSVRGDARRLSQVFRHLLDNAIKFSPNGGIVRTSLGCDGSMVRVSVQDQGIGLPIDQLERIFDRFYQVDSSSSRRYGGTGLGLALVKEVVEAHGGAVWAESEGVSGQGCTFTVFLPVYEPGAGG